MAIDYINGGCIKVTPVKAIQFVNNYEQRLALPISACIIDNIRKNHPQSCFSHSLQLRFIMRANPCKAFDEFKGIDITLSNDTIIQLGWGVVSSQHSAKSEEQSIGSYHVYTLHAGGYIKLQTANKVIIIPKKSEDLAKLHAQVYTIPRDNSQEHELQCVLSQINHDDALASINPNNIGYSLHNNEYGEPPPSATHQSLSERSPRPSPSPPQRRTQSDPSFLKPPSSSARYSGEIFEFKPPPLDPHPSGELSNNDLDELFTGSSESEFAITPPANANTKALIEINGCNFLTEHLGAYKEAINQTIFNIIGKINFSEIQYSGLLSTHEDFAIPVLDCYLSHIPLDHQMAVTRLCAIILFNTRQADKINHSWKYAFSRSEALVYQAQAELFTHLLLIYAVNNDLYSIWGKYTQQLSYLNILDGRTHLKGNRQTVLQQLLIQHDIIDSENTNLATKPSWQILALYIVPELKYYYLEAHLTYLTTSSQVSELKAPLVSLLATPAIAQASSIMTTLFHTFKLVVSIPLLNKSLCNILEDERNVIVNLLFWMNHYNLQHKRECSEETRHHLLSVQYELINFAIDHYPQSDNYLILHTSVSFKRVPIQERYQVLALLLAIDDAADHEKASWILALQNYVDQFRPQSPRAMAPTPKETIKKDETILISPAIATEPTPVIWVADNTVTQCTGCQQSFNWLTRKHHCRACGHIFCGSCSSKKGWVPANTIFRKGTNSEATTSGSWQRMCDSCHETNAQQPETIEVRHKIEEALAL